MRHLNIRTAVATLFLSLAVWGVSALSPAEAHARRGVMVFNTGEQIFPTGELPAPYNQDPELDGWQAGYKCEVFGVFWAYVWWWNCTPVAFADDSYVDEPEVVATLQEAYSEGDMQMGLWGGYGRLLLLPILLLILYGIYLQITGQDEDDEDGSEDDGEEQSSAAG